MAEAYRAIERIHPPLSLPLIDMNPQIAHKKLYWASSFQKIQEDIIANKDYSRIKSSSRKREVDDLIVLNVYTTAGTTPGWGLGPSPLSPLYLLYPGLHPLDSQLPKAPIPPSSRTSVLQAISDNYTKSPPKTTPARPCMLQYFLDRKDFSTRVNTTTTCIRFLHEYADWRLTFGPDENAGDSDAPLPSEISLLQKLGLKSCPETSIRILGQDTVAAKIYVSPIIRTWGPEKLTPIYISSQELIGDPGVLLYYSKSTDRRRKYWWVWEGSSWSCVYDPDGRTEWREGWTSSRENATRRAKEMKQAEAQGYASAGVNDVTRPASDVKFDELNCPTIKLYYAQYSEPVAAIELGAGQMWIQKTIVLETIDVAVAIIFAVVNMERSIRDERAMKARGTVNKFFKRHFSS